MTQLREYLKIKYMGDCKCGNCQLVPMEVLFDQVHYIDRLQDLVKTLLENDPTYPIADNGMTVLDGWRERARRTIADALIESPVQAVPDYGKMSVDTAIEACAKIVDPWPGFNVGQNISEPDISVIKVRTDLAAAIRTLQRPGYREYAALSIIEQAVAELARSGDISGVTTEKMKKLCRTLAVPSQKSGDEA